MLKEVKEHSFYDDAFQNKGIVIIDLGACRGEFIEEMNNSYTIEKAVLVEANPNNFKVLPKRDNYILYNNIISNTDGENMVFFEDCNSPYNGSSVFNYFSAVVKHNISSISLSRIMEDNNIQHVDVLKVDIEGSEYTLLDKLDRNIFDKIRQITVEFHDFINPVLKEETKEIVKKIESFGFKTISKSTGYMFGSEHYDVLFYK